MTGRHGPAAAEEVISVARALVDRRLVVGHAGNVSCRTPDGMLITPTRTAYSELDPAGLALVAADGGVPGDRAIAPGTAVPSQEAPLHLAIYAARADVGGIVHTHSVCATAWSHLGVRLLPETEDSVYLAIGPVETALPAPAGSTSLADGAVTVLATSRAVLLGEHGVLAVGKTPAEALVVAEAVEHQARIAWLLRDERPSPRRLAALTERA